MGIPIKLNIYDLTQLNFLLHPLGIGAYHSTVQIFDTEISFNLIDGKESAVIEHEPLSNKQLVFRCSILMGESDLSLSEVNQLISDAKRSYSEQKYDIFTKNCNHFSNELCNKLIKKDIPCYINRLAALGKYFRCFLKDSFIKGKACDKNKCTSPIINSCSSAKLKLSKNKGGAFVKKGEQNKKKPIRNTKTPSIDKKIMASFTVQKLSESQTNFLGKDGSAPSLVSTPTNQVSINIKEFETKTMKSEEQSQSTMDV